MIVALGCAGIVVLGCLLTFGGLVFLGLQPTASVQSASSLPEADREAVQRLLEPGEQLVYIYTQGITDFSTDSSVITDRRLLVYGSYHDPVTVQSARYAQVVDIEVSSSDNIFGETVITAELRDGSYIRLYGPADAEGRIFADRAMQEWGARRGVAPAALETLDAGLQDVQGDAEEP